jgi:hypothetical protein
MPGRKPRPTILRQLVGNPGKTFERRRHILQMLPRTQTDSYLNSLPGRSRVRLEFADVAGPLRLDCL